MGRPKLTATVRNAVAHRRMRCRLHDLEREASETGFGELIGNSEPMRRVYREITRLAQSEITVLVFGESGTGKELVARALHDHSGRSRAPFVALNCAAVPENLQESEFFGHEKGAFTGAEERRIGRFEQADGGTLFLDEVGELSPGLQAKLLRVLQERRITRVGGSREFEVDVRVVAATHIDLLEAVEAGSFRQDLYFRLAVYEMQLPALRERGEDIIELAKTFAQALTPPERPVPELAQELQALLRAYGWPGNVRELKNAIHRALVAADGEVIIRALDETGGNVSEVIRRLGIPRTTLYRKLKAYGLR